MKEKYRSIGKILFFLQTLLVNYWLSHSAWVDRIIYGDETDRIYNSSYSIVKLAVAFSCSFLVMDILYRGRRLAKLYLLLVFCTIQEMARFILYSVWSLSFMRYMDYLTEQIISESIDPERFYEITERLQIYSMSAFTAGSVLLMYVALRSYRRYMTGTVEEMSGQGLCFLMLTPFIGLTYDVVWRVTFYSQKGAEIELIYDKHGSMYIVVPIIAVSCMVCTVFSRKIYGDLMRYEEQRNSLIFYRQQLSDMTEHVKELELLYDGIKGMRHDINNYVADMEQLLCPGEKRVQIPEQVREEAEGYLQNIQRTAEQLSLHFNTGNPVTDVILNRKDQLCIEEHIVLEGDLIFPAKLGIEAFDLGILLNNALDNAIEACRKVPEGQKREIHFRGYIKGQMFFLVVENTYDGAPMQSGKGGLRTTKEDETVHGIGMNNMRNCVEKYYGTMEHEVRENRFVLTLMMQGRQA